MVAQQRQPGREPGAESRSRTPQERLKTHSGDSGGVRRPRGAPGQGPGLCTADALVSLGVPVSKTPGELAPEERETALSLLETENVAEITTSSPAWMRRLEELGWIPMSLTVFGDGAEIRVYQITKSAVWMPDRGPGKPA